MRYASMRSLDISNGENVGVSLFVQGCHFHCYNCFNSNTWDFDSGKEWTEETENKFMELINRPYIKRISILGGEPLADENVVTINTLLTQIKKDFSNKIIWIYSGYTWEQIFDNHQHVEVLSINKNRQDVIFNSDILVDGRFINSKKDITLKWRGSSNQRVIDIKKSIKENKIILYCD